MADNRSDLQREAYEIYTLMNALQAFASVASDSSKDSPQRCCPLHLFNP